MIALSMMRRFLSSLLIVCMPFVPSQDVWVEFCIRHWARQYDLDEECFLELAYRESGLDPEAVGADRERGLFQFLPDTWRWLCELLGLDPDFDLAFNPWHNARLAALVLRKFEGKFDHWWKALPHCDCAIREAKEWKGAN